MSNISKIVLPDSSQYDLKDSYARTWISNHIIVSSTQPSSSIQIPGDIWIVMEEQSQIIGEEVEQNI